MFAWLAVFVLLSNAVLPTVLVIGLAGQSPGRGDLRLDLCSTSPGGDAPGKAKPGLLLHHCALCIAASDVLPPERRPAVALPFVVLVEAYPPGRSTALWDRWRNYRTQPRAPPATA